MSKTKYITTIIAAALIGGFIATHVRDTVILGNCQTETPAAYRARMINEAVATPGDEARCLALVDLFTTPGRECTTDLDCEAKEEFDLQECCWNDGGEESPGC